MIRAQKRRIESRQFWAAPWAGNPAINLRPRSLMSGASDGGTQEKTVPFSSLNVIPHAVFSDLSPAERLMFAGLQGLASLGAHPIYCIADNFKNIPFYPMAAHLWLQDIDLPRDYLPEPWLLLERYPEIQGYILCDIANHPESVNIATSLAGILQALPVDISLQGPMNRLGYEQVADVRGWQFCDFLGQYWSAINPEMAVELSPSQLWGIRDFAVANGAVVMHGTDQRNMLLPLLNAPAAIYGGSPMNCLDRKNFVQSIAAHGAYHIPSETAFNLSTLGGLDVDPIPVPVIPGPSPELATGAGARTDIHVAFVLSDGDDLQWLLNRGDHDAWWGSPSRGEIPLGWTFSPALYRLAPSVWNYYMDTMTAQDELICGASGIGYCFEDIAFNEGFKEFLSQTDEFMAEAGIDLVEVFGNKFPDKPYLQGYTKQPSVKGVLYTSYSPWVVPLTTSPLSCNGKAIIPASINLSGNVTQVARQILDTGPVPAQYLIHVNAWGNDCRPLEMVQAVYDLIKDKVTVVKPSTLCAIAAGEGGK